VAFGGNSPFQAEVYFINLAGINQIRFGVPYFDVFDPRFMDFAVPVAVRGTLTFKLVDYKAFIKLHRLIDFNLETFKAQVKAAILKYIKSIVSNAPEKNQIPVMQLERKILEISDLAQGYIATRMESEFGVTVSSVDIDAIEANKDSDGYKKLMSVTQDIAAPIHGTKYGVETWHGGIGRRKHRAGIVSNFCVSHAAAATSRVTTACAIRRTKCITKILFMPSTNWLILQMAAQSRNKWLLQ
jgi:hypothetical protein